jgi:uncharacterized protein YjiS (DUF1127 family)
MEEGMIEALSQTPDAGLRPVCLAALAARARRFRALLALWRARTRERRMLAALDERLLRDIGVTRLDAAYECDKPFWRA